MKKLKVLLLPALLTLLITMGSANLDGSKETEKLHSVFSISILINYQLIGLVKKRCLCTFCKYLCAHRSRVMTFLLVLIFFSIDHLS